MSKLIDDLNVVTSVPRTTLIEMNDISEDIIAHVVFEMKKEGRTETSINIGIGMLYIKYEGNAVKYRFVPSKKLEDKVSHTLLNGISPLVDRAAISLREKLTKAYKELL